MSKAGYLLAALLLSILVWVGIFWIGRTAIRRSQEDGKVSLDVMSKEDAVNRWAGGVIRLPRMPIAVECGADVAIPENEGKIERDLIIAYSDIVTKYWNVDSCRVTGSSMLVMNGKRYWIYTIYPLKEKSKKPTFVIPRSSFRPTQGGVRRKTREINYPQQVDISGFLFFAIIIV
jgi:hypothetical protein